MIPHVHREGGIGQQSRDAMLLCMSLSKKNDEVGLYIADQSNICPVNYIYYCKRIPRNKTNNVVESYNIKGKCYISLGTSYRFEWSLFFVTTKT